MTHPLPKPEVSLNPFGVVQGSSRSDSPDSFKAIPVLSVSSSVLLNVHIDRTGTDYYSGRGAQDGHLDFRTASEL